MLSGRTFLITGATGRLGRDLTARLEALEASVLPLVLQGYPALPKSLPWITRSRPILVRGADDLRDLRRPDYAIHLHWRVDRSRPFAEQVVNELDWNVHSPAFLWDWLKEQPSLQGFVNCSSIRVFSSRNAGPVGADTEPRPLTPYGLAKLAGEKFFSAYFPSRLPVTHLRLCTVCSFGEHPSQLISRLAASAFDGERIRVNAGRLVNLIYIDEAVDVIINAALLAQGSPLLAVTPGRDVEEIAKVFERVADRPLNAERVEPPPGISDPEFASDLDRLRADWVRVTSLEEAMRRIIEQWQTRKP